MSSLPAPPCDLLPQPPESDPALQDSFGRFTDEGYVIEKTPTPAPWCNILCSRDFGSLITERGGGFIWYRNSRSGRITPFDNDPLQESCSDRLILSLEDGSSILPFMQAARVTHRPGSSLFEGECESLSWAETQFVPPDLPIKVHHLILTALRLL